MKNDALIQNNRREFIIKTLSSCAFCCFAAPGLFAFDEKSHPFVLGQQHKFQSDAGMTLEQVFNFTFKGWYIPAMKNLMQQIGRERFLEMLKKSSEMLYETDKDTDVNYNERTMAALSEYGKKLMEKWSNRLTGEILTDNGNEFEVKYTECLWAKTFREADAADIGYAGICYTDYPWTKQFNPDLKLIREKTLMQGHDCCHFKYFMENK